MSSAGAIRTARAAVARPATSRTTTRPPAPRLRLVSTPENLRSRGGLVAACLGLLAVGLIGLLVMTVSLGRGAYQLGQLRADTTELTEQRQALQEEIASLQAPQNLEARARGLGMVPAPNAAVVRRSDGVVLGEPKAAAGLPAPMVPHAAQPPTSPSPSAKPTGAQSVGTAAQTKTPAVKPVTKPVTKPKARPTSKPVAQPTAAG